MAGVVMTIGGVVGGLVYGVLAVRNDWPTSGLPYFGGTLLAVYVIFFVAYEVMTWAVFGKLDATTLHDTILRTTPRTSEQRWIALLTFSGARSWAVTAAALALFTVLAVGLVGELRSSPVIVLLSLAVVVTAWLMIPFAFAVAFARMQVDEGGLEFPHDIAPVWSDYFYLAVQVATTFSSSDVTVTSTRMRRLVGAQSLISFVFNTVIVALLVSVLITVTG